MVNDTIADLLTRIRNAHLAGHASATAPVSKVSENVLKVLKSEGFIEGYEVKKQELGSFDAFRIHLRYYKSGEPAISILRRVSKPGLRSYSGKEKLDKIHRGLGIAIISTSQGIMSDREARRKKIGGEVLAHVA